VDNRHSILISACRIFSNSTCYIDCIDRAMLLVYCSTAGHIAQTHRPNALGHVLIISLQCNIASHWELPGSEDQQLPLHGIACWQRRAEKQISRSERCAVWPVWPVNRTKPVGTGLLGISLFHNPKKRGVAQLRATWSHQCCRLQSTPHPAWTCRYAVCAPRYPRSAADIIIK
jgi:hypothetical protein